MKQGKKHKTAYWFCDLLYIVCSSFQKNEVLILRVLVNTITTRLVHQQ